MSNVYLVYESELRHKQPVNLKRPCLCPKQCLC